MLLSRSQYDFNVPLIFYSQRRKLYLSLLYAGQDTPRILNLFWAPTLTRSIDNWNVSTGWEGVMEPCKWWTATTLATTTNLGIFKLKKTRQKWPLAFSKYLKCCHKKNGLDLYWVAPSWELQPINEKCRGTPFQHNLRKKLFCLILTVKGLPQEVMCSVLEVSKQKPFDYIVGIFVLGIWFLDESRVK